MTRLLESYAAGRWYAAPDEGTPLHDASTGEEVARISSTGLDLAGAARYARDVGGPALRALTFHERAGILKALADAREAARGLGMSRAQLLWGVQLPLGWPVLLAGLRIVAVQTIGLAAVAALSGAGGLGRFVFLGIGQGAMDMVLLGTLAIIALALVVDLLFQGLLVLTERRA